MNRKLSGVFALIASGAVGSVALASALTAGCSSSNDGGTPGGDSGAQQDGTTIDAQGQDDAAADVGSTPDVTVVADAGLDVATIDQFVAPDSSNLPDAPSVVVPDLSGYALAIDVAYCRRLGECCMVQPGQQWQQDKCSAFFERVGGVYGQATYKSATTDAGSIAYDRGAAAACLTTLAGINCGAVPASAFGSLIDLCYSAVKGTQPIDTGTCVDSLQCKPGEYCATQEGGPGTCVALQSAGQPCADTTRSSECSYRGTGSPQFYCGSTDAGNTCLPALAMSKPCGGNLQCQSHICNTQGPGCLGSYSFSDYGSPFGFCAAFTVDGGAPVMDAAADGGAPVDGSGSDAPPE